jgi:hypothetical protein
MTARIIKAHITAVPRSRCDPMLRVFVTVDDGTAEQFLLDFHPDEISFTPEEFVGLTINEALALKLLKTYAYLRS